CAKAPRGPHAHAETQARQREMCDFVRQRIIETSVSPIPKQKSLAGRQPLDQLTADDFDRCAEAVIGQLFGFEIAANGGYAALAELFVGNERILRPLSAESADRTCAPRQRLHAHQIEIDVQIVRIAAETLRLELVRVVEELSRAEICGDSTGGRAALV